MMDNWVAAADVVTPFKLAVGEEATTVSPWTVLTRVGVVLIGDWAEEEEEETRS